MINIKNSLSEEKKEHFIDGFIKMLKSMIYFGDKKSIYYEMYTFEKKFYRTIMKDRSMLLELVYPTVHMLANFTEMNLYKKNRTFFLTALNSSRVENLKIRNDLTKLSKNLPREIRNVGLYDAGLLVAERCKKIINYSKFSKVSRNIQHTANEWDAYNFLNNYAPTICPYCNLDPITHIYIINDKQEATYVTRPPIDHFLSKDLYPFFALTITNLIPCCHTCNSSYKLQKDFLSPKRVNPVGESFKKETKFILKPKNNIREIMKNLYNRGEWDPDLFTIDFESENDDDRGNIKDFGIIDRYRSNMSAISNFIQKVPRMNREYIEEYAKISKINIEKAFEDFSGLRLEPESDADHSLSVLKRHIFNAFGRI